MKKQTRGKARNSDRMRPEYDFSKGARGKHAARYASGTNVVVLAPDVASQFRTADDVNDTLRAVTRLIERRRSRSKHQTA
jgi:phosphoribosylpyrophosphate synthetase